MKRKMGRGSCSPRLPRTLRAGHLPGVLFVLVTLLTACLAIPVKAPRVKTPTSETIKGKVDLAFLQEGKTLREEVLQKLGHLSAGYENPNLFVARWLDSKWMFLWAAGGYYTGGAGAARNWGAHTLFVTFDEMGVARQVEFVADKQLLQTLQARRLGDAPPVAGETFSVKLMHSHTWSMARPGLMALGSSGVELREEGKKKHDFLTPLTNVEKFRLHGIYAVGPEPRPNEFLVSVTFHERTKGGAFLLFHIDFSQLVTLVQRTQELGVKFE